MDWNKSLNELCYSSCSSPCVYNCCCDVVNDGPWVPMMVYSTGTPRLFWNKSVGFFVRLVVNIQCCDTVGWATGRA